LRERCPKRKITAQIQGTLLIVLALVLVLERRVATEILANFYAGPGLTASIVVLALNCLWIAPQLLRNRSPKLTISVLMQGALLIVLAFELALATLFSFVYSFGGH
jgi:hypothetical protein